MSFLSGILFAIMKRTRDGNVPNQAEEHALRDRILKELQRLVCKPYFLSIQHLNTEALQDLYATLNQNILKAKECAS